MLAAGRHLHRGPDKGVALVPGLVQAVEGQLQQLGAALGLHTPWTVSAHSQWCL